MGGCYSADSHRVLASPRHKLPKDKGAKQNGKGPDYSPLSVSNGGGGVHHHEELIKTTSGIPVSTESVVPVVGAYSTGGTGERGCIAPSDSGIESIGSPQEDLDPAAAEAVDRREFTLCRACHHKLKRLSRSSCHHCGHFRIGTVELSTLVNGNTYCTCGPRQPGKLTTCQTHGARGKAAPTHRHSDVPGGVLKSNLKKHGLGGGDSKHVRMSWKSSDSLDMNGSMNTCMDRAKSEASDVFGDDVSFRAPLAQFDSVDKQLNDEPVEEEDCDAAFLASRMSIYSEILDLADCICKCDFSGETSAEPHQCASGQSAPRNSSAGLLQGVAGSNNGLLSSPGQSCVENGHACLDAREEEDEDSGHGVSKSEDYSGSASDSELEVIEEGSLSSNSSPLRY